MPGQSTVALSDPYPVTAIIVSDALPNGKANINSKLAVALIPKVLRAAKPPLPAIVIAGSDSTYKDVVAAVMQMDVSDEQKEAFKNVLMKANTNSYTWQRDYMRSFVNPITGRGQLREVSGYRQVRPAVMNSIEEIVHNAEDCDVSWGDKIEVPASANANSGGNLEVLPGGVCAVGSGDFETGAWEKISDQLCGVGSPRVKVPTDWQIVGHTDEVMKVVPRPNAKAPCDFAVGISSPGLALQLLKNSDAPAFELPGGTSSANLKSKIDQTRSISKICSLFANPSKQIENGPSSSPQNLERSKRGGRGTRTTALSEILESWFAIKPAQAGLAKTTSQNCLQMTGRQLHDVITSDADLTTVNRLAQAKLSALKKDVERELKLKFPSCAIDIFEIPDLYDARLAKTASGEQTMVLKSGSSIFPNSANSVVIDNTVISSDPGVGVFHEFQIKAYEARGLKAEFVDTFSLHQGEGNLHCATNTVHTCKPRGTRL